MVPADSMSVAELRAELTQLRVRSSHCVEKHELVALLLKTREDDAAGRGGLKGNNDVRASSATRHSTATPGRTTTPVSRNSTYTNGRSSRSAAEEPAWQGYVIAAVIVAWLWNSVSDSAEGPRDLLVSDANSWAYDDTMKKAYIDGEVSEMRRHESYLGAISHHRDLTGLPVVVDIYSDGCGPCRQIAPIYKAAAKRFAGQAVFLKVDSMRNQRTVAALGGRGLPTFAFILNGRLVEKFAGANAQKLLLTVESLVKESKKQGTFRGVDPPISFGVCTCKYDQSHLIALLSLVFQKDEPISTDIVRAFFKSHVDETDVVKLAEAAIHEFSGKPAALSRHLKENYGHAIDFKAVASPDQNSRHPAAGPEPTPLPEPIETPGKTATSDDQPESVMSDVAKKISRRLMEGLQALPSSKGAGLSAAAWLEKLEPSFLKTAESSPDSTSAPGSTSNSASQPNPGLSSITDADLAAELAFRMNAAAMPEAMSAVGYARAPSRRSTEALVIIGAGPGGLSAAIYGARAGLRPLVVAPAGGGQLLGKGVDVENYPGMWGLESGASYNGRGVVQVMRRQAADAGARFIDGIVDAADLSGKTFTLLVNGTAPEDMMLPESEKKRIFIDAHAVIVASGANSRWLGIPGEEALRGSGVSTCATCDGFGYSGTDVVVIGGGDTAMEDALVLARTSRSVTVVHRKDTFRASSILAKRVQEHPKITVKWNTVVKRFIANNQNALSAVVLATTNDDAVEETLKVAAAFVAIGHDPATNIWKSALELDSAGYLKLFHSSTATSVPGIFACGDVSDHVYRQAITSAGTGAAAAIDAERWLSEQGLVGA